MTNENNLMETREKDDLLYIKHFTQLPRLLNNLENKAIFLGNPANWPDKNDAASVEAYRRNIGAKTIRAICLSYGLEMVHHWETYAEGKSGCCIMLNSEKLLTLLNNSGHFLHGKMEYISRDDLTKAKLKDLSINKIPFIKRRPYECEQEYRVIWTGDDPDKVPTIPIADCIDYVTLSPHFCEYSANSVSKLLKDRYAVTTKRSRILKNDSWISLFDNLD